MDKLESSYSIQHLYTSTTQPQQQQWKIKPYILLLCASTIQRQICKLTVKTDCENCNQFFFVFIANLVILYHWCNWMVLFRVVLVRIGLRKMLTVSRSLSHTIYIALCVLPIRCVLRARSLLMLFFFALYLFQLNHQNSRNLLMEMPFIHIHFKQI